jgi:putative endopeptidase
MTDLFNKPNVNDDFYTHINWEWLNSNSIPNEYTKWSNFHVLYEQNQHRLREMLEVEPVTNEQYKLSILWNQGLDIEQLNMKGHKHLSNLFNKFKLDSDIDTILIQLFEYNLCCLFDISVYTDFKDSSKNVLYLDVMRLGLPGRDYYLNEKMKDKQDQYKVFLSRFKNHFGLEYNVDTLYNFEEQIAKTKLSKTERRDPNKIYNLYSFDNLVQEFQGINWTYIFNELNIPTHDKIIVTEPVFFKFISKYIQLANTNQETMNELKNFIKYKLIKSVCVHVDEPSYMVYFDFYCKQLYGQKEPKQTWKRVLSKVESVLGEVLSKIYVDKYFNQEQKINCINMINQILLTYRERLNELEWMSLETKQKAIEKLNKFTVKIGFPDKWTDFSKLEISTDKEYYENFLEANKWEFKRNLEKLYKPVDKLEWHMNAHDINAYYSPSKNEIVFPAGILQEPFYSSSQSLAENLGGIGAVIGHEITHGFDDKGRLYDSDGNLNNWWTNDDTTRFEEKSIKLEQLFNGFSYYDINVNGKLTLGENIADLGGITFSLKTLERLVSSDDKQSQTKKIFEQWAKIWRCNITPDTLKNQLLTDPHSPTQLRVNAILSNIDEFYEVYQIKPQDKMFLAPELRSKIW